MQSERLSCSDTLRPSSGDEIRRAFIDFYSQRGHKVIDSASLVPKDPTVLLTIAGMLPFKTVFLGQEEPPARRATSSQKCIRTNDIENVGRTARHHTFFEMLGNFSFGDYFKKQAIQWSWELCIDVFKLDPNNLVISVFRDDKEAEMIWRDVIGVSSQKIIRMGESDNFWISGPTGPCGPCSEIYYDFHPELGVDIDLEDDNRFIEFYNLVFMEYNRDAKGIVTPLANRCIDTGLGLERMAQILQGVPNNYETDLIYPLIRKAASLASIDYHKVDDQLKTSLKIIGDHSRAITQLISDGVLPSNLGRGYVLRRLIRRVIRHGRLIGISKPFVVEMGSTAIDLMKSSYPALMERSEIILRELLNEEERFMVTLDRGEKLLADFLAAKPETLSGQKAFELYDTYGFPIELTKEIVEESGLTVDIKGFEKCMDEQRKRAKAANISIDLTLQDAVNHIVNECSPTNFLGYHLLEHATTIRALVVNGQRAQKAIAGEEVQLVLDSTPFYGEGGGQIGDIGLLKSSGSNSSLVEIQNVTRNRNVFVHIGKITSGFLEAGSEVIAIVHSTSRRRAQVNHTATHLLQAALKQVVDPVISQAGSLVNFDRLRFDFHYSKALTADELTKIEQLVNLWISEAHLLEVSQMNIQEAKVKGAIAMFGEKYADIVRVVDVPGVSMELCGGTHVNNTSEIGLFKLISEVGIASGVRRIEAVAGFPVLEYLNERDILIKQLSERFKVHHTEIIERVVSLQNDVKSISKELATTQEELALAKALACVSSAESIGNVQVLVERLDGIEGSALQIAAKTLINQLGESSAVILGGVPQSNDQSKVTLVAAFGSDVIARGLHAGNFIGGIAKICGGGGGGRRDVAQAGGREANELEAALQSARNQLLDFLDD